MKRLAYAYLIGLGACFTSLSIANRPQVGRWNNLAAAMLGLSASVADSFGLRNLIFPTVVAAAVLSLIFVMAEAFRSREGWLRWAGYALWGLLALSTLWWFRPPPI